MSHGQPPEGRAASPRVPFRDALWDYLGHPADETPERRRILYAIVILRLGLGLMFLLRGWGAVFATTPDAFATRLGDPAGWGLGGLATDTTLFFLGCTELGVGLLLLAGAFTRVSAVTGALLALLYLLFGARTLFLLAYSRGPGEVRFQDWREPNLGDALAVVSLLAALGGLLVLIVCGSPFLGTDRALDKLEEEERDRHPAVLPRSGVATPIFLRLGLAGALIWLGLWEYWRYPNQSLMNIVFSAVAALPLIVGLGSRLVAAPFLLLPALLYFTTPDPWRVLAESLIAPPVVALALLVTGPGSLSLKQRLLARQSAPPAPVGN